MARKVTTEYTCDSCGVTLKTAKELRRFKLEVVRRGRKWGPTAASDLCADCESALLANVEPFFGTEELPSLVAMRREEE